MVSWRTHFENNDLAALGRIKKRLDTTTCIKKCSSGGKRSFNKIVGRVIAENTEHDLDGDMDKDPPPLLSYANCYLLEKSIAYNGMEDSYDIDLYSSLDEVKDSIEEFIFPSTRDMAIGPAWSRMCRAYDLDTGKELQYETIQVIHWKTDVVELGNSAIGG